MIGALALGVSLQLAGVSGAVIERARIDPRADVSFHAMVSPDTVYVGDAVLYELAVFISEDARQRLRRNPEFVPPELRSVLAYDLADPRGARTITRDGQTYEVHVFRRALFPVAPGRVVVPPARLTYTMPLSVSFFSREEQRELRSEAVTIVAVAPPSSGRPATWDGAVGNLRVSASVDASSARVGDPFVLTLRVAGSGHIHLLPRPRLALRWANVVPGSERVQVDSLATLVRGAKEFDWLVTPEADGRAVIPAVEYSYFDPVARRYRVARSAPAEVAIEGGSVVSVDTTSGLPVRRPPLALREEWRSGLPESPDRALWYWVLAAIVPVPVLVRAVRERPRHRTRALPDASLRELAARSSDDPGAVRAALHDALTARLAPTPLPWTDAAALRRTLRHHGVTPATIDQVQVLLARLDGGAYGGAGPVPAAAQRALELCGRIDAEARGARMSVRASVRRGAAGLVLATGCFAAVAAAPQDPLAPRARFAQAVADHQAGNQVTAALEFLELARQVPDAAVAWANAGTASWAVADTARAVAAWQRALRLDPLDAGVRRALSLVGADAGASERAVWPVPRRAPAWMALLLWTGGWAGLWLRRRRSFAVAAIAAAVCLAVLSRVHVSRLVDPQTAIVAHPAPLRVLPALGAEPGPVPLTGELVHITERSGVWVRVVASGGREGWLDAARLLTLDARPLRE